MNELRNGKKPYYRNPREEVSDPIEYLILMGDNLIALLI